MSEEVFVQVDNKALAPYLKCRPGQVKTQIPETNFRLLAPRNLPSHGRAHSGHRTRFLRSGMKEYARPKLSTMQIYLRRWVQQ